MARGRGELAFVELLIIRVLNVPVEILCRALDLLLLLPRPRLLRAFLRLWWEEIVRSPYRWPTRSFETVRRLKAASQGIEELVYGELPVWSALWLFWRSGVRRGSTLLDLGAGRGRPLLAAAYLGARAAGVELLEAHVRAAGPALEGAGIELRAGDIKVAPLGSPSHVLLNWCGLTDETRDLVEQRLLALAPGTRVIAVVKPPRSKRLVRVRGHLLLFTWGLATVTVHELGAP